MSVCGNTSGSHLSFCEDVRVVKERDSSSRGASRKGSIPFLRIEVRHHLLQE